MTLDLPGTLFLQIVGLAPGIPLLRTCSVFYVNLPLEAIGREINTELLEVEVLAERSKNAFHRALLPVQRNSLFRIGDCCSVLDNVATRASLHDETDQEELPRTTFLSASGDKMTSQATPSTSIQSLPFCSDIFSFGNGGPPLEKNTA